MWYAVIYVVLFTGQPMVYIAPREYADREQCIESVMQAGEAIKDHVAAITVGCSRISGRGA